MAITNTLQKTLNPKVWTNLVKNPWGSTTAGGFVTGEYSKYQPENDFYFHVIGAATIIRYSPSENAHISIPASGIAGAFGAGACGETMSYGCPGGEILITATGGTTNSITTNKTLQMNCVGYKVKIVEGPNAGNEYTIAYNGVGANATIVIDTVAPLAFTSSTKFQLMTGSLWFFCPSTTTSGFAVYDNATNAWTQRSVSPITTWATEGQLFKQHNAHDNFASGSVISAAATTVTVGGLVGTGWDYTNFEIEIISGTGAGQYRKITAGSTNTFTVASWTIVPDATSTYCIKGDRTALYLCGNNSVGLYKYDITTNTWALIVPTVVRTAGIASGGTADCVKDIPEWNTPIVVAGKVGGQNGRFVYSFRGAGNVSLDLYDIATNKWINDTYYGGRGQAIDSTACAVTDGNEIYIMAAATGRYYKFDIVRNHLKPFAHNAFIQSTGVNGDKMFIVKVKSGEDEIRWLYSYTHTTDLLQRMLIV